MMSEPVQKEWLRFRLSTLLIAFVVLAVVMTTLAPGTLPVGHRLGFITLLFFPAWLGWKSVLYQAPFLLNFGNGLAIGAITFLALCFSDSLEAKLTTGAAHMIIGVVGSIVGYAIARTMIAASDISAVRPSSRFRFRKFLTLLITMSVLLTLIFAGGRSYFARIRNSQIELSEAVGNWDATLFYEQTDLPWNLGRFLLDKVLIPKGICFYDQVPADATSFLAQHDTITIVAFRGKNIDDESLARIPKSLELEQLIFCDTRVTDDGMQLLQQWPKIVGLHLYDTPITSLCIKRLAQRDSLKVMEVFGSEISPDEKETIRQLRPRGFFNKYQPYTSWSSVPKDVSALHAGNDLWRRSSSQQKTPYHRPQAVEALVGQRRFQVSKSLMDTVLQGAFVARNVRNVSLCRSDLT